MDFVFRNCAILSFMPTKRSHERSVRLVHPPDATRVGVLCLLSRGTEAFYAFKEIPCAIGGRGFVVHRLGLGELYHVRVGAPVECSCECLGFLAHDNCKHIRGLIALIEHGAI
jgi:hypothetical protein